jgi:glycerol-3-phosphate dehydrogenase
MRPEDLHDEAGLPVIRPSRGTHITIAGDKLPLNDGVIVPAGEGRSIFALPWLGSTLIGTTDNDYDETDLDHVSPGAADIEYLLEATNEFFMTDFDASDVSGAFAGVRPLIATGDPKKSVDISRRAELYETGNGMITITGGKLTTWRRMAKMAVDRIVERDSREAPCRTEEIPLGQAIRADELPRVEGVPEAAYEQLAGRYGYRARDVLAVAAERGELAQPIVASGPTDLLAEVVFAARHEQARSVGDALLRRSRVALLAAREVTGDDDAVARRVANAMAGELGWDEARVEAEVDAFSAEAAAEGIVANVAPTA